MSCLIFHREILSTCQSHTTKATKLAHDLMSCPSCTFVTLLNRYQPHMAPLSSPIPSKILLLVNYTRPNVVSEGGKHGLIFFTATVPFPQKQKSTSTKNGRNPPLFPDFHLKCFRNPLFPNFLPQKTQKLRETMFYCFFFKNNRTVSKMNSKTS